jgi:catechol 2,3-dioxygenase-like lactoylglutathione lyase family enzyme
MLADSTPHATLPASDMARARQFYEGVLGFTPQMEVPAGVFYGSGEGRFLVFPSAGTASGSHTQMGWAVDDIEAEVRALQSKGVTFEEYDFPDLKTENGIATTGPVKAAWLHDTEGNLLGIVQFLS